MQLTSSNTFNFNRGVVANVNSPSLSGTLQYSMKEFRYLTMWVVDPKSKIHIGHNLTDMNILEIQSSLEYAKRRTYRTSSRRAFTKYPLLPQLKHLLDSSFLPLCRHFCIAFFGGALHFHPCLLLPWCICGVASYIILSLTATILRSKG